MVVVLVKIVFFGMDSCGILWSDFENEEICGWEIGEMDWV